MTSLLPIHVFAAILGIVSGFVALYAAKGATLHRKSGMIFVYAMLVMAGLGAGMAMAKFNRGNMLGGGLTFYLVATGMLTVRPRGANVERMHLAAMVPGLAVAIAGLTFGVQALQSATGRLNGYPPPLYFIFATIALLSLAGDVRMIQAQGLQGASRIARHLWRMCFALLIAAASFVLVPRRIPEPLRIPALLSIPVLVPILAMLYWLWRIRVRRSGHSVLPVSASGYSAGPGVSVIGPPTASVLSIPTSDPA